ncbi:MULTISPECIES: DUF1641 domain-containing protein [Staphylococcus]|jgi:uncharacterized protein YjgD (DUF1641 family)|uniref:DUF1641 domain-containing protein n=1 Tax=Staphylococcus nepalensis TaxID=214473 RepID=A0A291JI68_9STAP|nr:MULTISPECIES: DUF1641 domain-containing protein [Staphylococcus]VDG66382.1 Uncharacterized conserved protein [Lacrimispora indolis]ATH59442.1 hypothetical protein BJD96_03340 [Staphylococcus nepalensis]ATH64534.1 hypothetical protein BJG89_03685 [Staphylococcus nepalensis]AWI43891.1 hypothetical protein BJG88_03410 [Staphylococcus nepalensis]MBO1205762.1 DUF1641 domain-containing protein [Staphylococcus nepalensis]
MAERITHIKRMQKSEAQIKQESLAEVTDAIAANKDSIMKAINIISTLDEAKLLDALSGMVKSRGVIANKFSVELNKEQYTGLITNMASLVFLLGDLNVNDLSQMLNKVNKGLSVANQASPNQKTSITGLMGVLKDDEMNRSLTYMLNMLRGMSRE